MSSGDEPISVYLNDGGPDLPSFMTYRELQQVFTFVATFAIEGGLPEESTMVGIHVRDRGPTSQMSAQWIEFSVGFRNFAMWRNTLDLYEVGPDGAVGDEPLYRND